MTTSDTSTPSTTRTTTSQTTTGTTTAEFGVFETYPANNSEENPADLVVLVVFLGLVAPGNGKCVIVTETSGASRTVAANDATQLIFGTKPATSTEPARGILRLSPIEGFPAGATGEWYSVSCSADVVTAAGGATPEFDGIDSFRFRIADTTRPMLVKSNPVDGAQNVALDVRIVLEFSETVVSYSPTENNISLVAHGAEVMDDELVPITVQFPPSAPPIVVLTPKHQLSSDKAYKVSAPDGAFIDVYRRLPTAAISVTFTTADVEPPIITATVPAAGTAGSLYPDMLVKVTFDEPIQIGTGHLLLTSAANNSTHAINVRFGDRAAAGVVGHDTLPAPHVLCTGRTMVVDVRALLLPDGGQAANYSLVIPTGVVRDLAEPPNSFAGPPFVIDLWVVNLLHTAIITPRAVAAGSAPEPLRIDFIAAVPLTATGQRLTIRFPIAADSGQRFTAGVGFRLPVGIVDSTLIDVNWAGVNVSAVGIGRPGINGSHPTLDLEFRADEVTPGEPGNVPILAPAGLVTVALDGIIEVPHALGLTANFAVELIIETTSATNVGSTLATGLTLANLYPPTFPSSDGTSLAVELHETYTVHGHGAAMGPRIGLPALVTTLHASDLDEIPGFPLRYELVNVISGDPNTVIELPGLFAVNTTTGAVTVTRHLDFDAAGVVPPNFTLVVDAVEGSPPFRRATQEMIVVLIDLNDHAPRFVLNDPPLEYYTVLMHALDVRSGGVLLAIRATDGDSGLRGIVRYSLDNTADGRSTADASYTLDTETGELVIMRPPSPIGLSYAQLTVVATDGAAQPRSAVAPVQICYFDDSVLIEATVTALVPGVFDPDAYAKLISTALCSANSARCNVMTTIYKYGTAAGLGSFRHRRLETIEALFYTREVPLNVTTPSRPRFVPVSELILLLASGTGAAAMGDNDLGVVTVSLSARSGNLRPVSTVGDSTVATTAATTVSFTSSGDTDQFGGGDSNGDEPDWLLLLLIIGAVLLLCILLIVVICLVRTKSQSKKAAMVIANDHSRSVWSPVGWRGVSAYRPDGESNIYMDPVSSPDRVASIGAAFRPHSPEYLQLGSNSRFDSPYQAHQVMFEEDQQYYGRPFDNPL